MIATAKLGNPDNEITKTRPIQVTLGPLHRFLTYSEACELVKDLSRSIAVYTDSRRAKNTDPAKLNHWNEGDAVVVTLEDGSTQSGTITDVTENICRVAWKTGPNPSDYKYVWVRKDLWATRLQLFPAGAKFLVGK